VELLNTWAHKHINNLCLHINKQVIDTTLAEFDKQKQQAISTTTMRKLLQVVHLVELEKEFKELNMVHKLYKIGQHFKLNYYNKDLVKHNKLLDKHLIKVNINKV
jgi:predicted TIM-barrel fold metal-dependent hydrolase